MKAPFLLIALALLAACSDDDPAQQSSQAPPAVAQQAKGDVAVLEATEAQPATDPCDLRGYDMSKMTVDQHEDLVKLCAKSKQ